jgi:hypothetical protein
MGAVRVRDGSWQGLVTKLESTQSLVSLREGGRRNMAEGARGGADSIGDAGLVCERVETQEVFQR